METPNVFTFGSKMSGEFMFPAPATDRAGTSSFEPHGTDPAMEAYSVLVEYNDGYMQNLLPSISALEQVALCLDTYFAGRYTLNRVSGVFTIDGNYSFKPSYLLTALTPAEAPYYNQAKNAQGWVFCVGNYVGNYKEDVLIANAHGWQILQTM